MFPVQVPGEPRTWRSVWGGDYFLICALTWPGEALPAGSLWLRVEARFACTVYTHTHTETPKCDIRQNAQGTPRQESSQGGGPRKATWER